MVPDLIDIYKAFLAAEVGACKPPGATQDEKAY